jgi:hypothetical protein
VTEQVAGELPVSEHDAGVNDPEPVVVHATDPPGAIASPVLASSTAAVQTTDRPATVEDGVHATAVAVERFATATSADASLAKWFGSPA